MTLHNTPPPSQPGPGAAGPRRSSAGRPIMIATAVFGGLALLTVGTTAAVAAVGDARAFAGDSSSSASAAGVKDVDLDIGGAEVTLAFGDVAEASIETSGRDSDRWTLRREGDDLVVKSPNRFMDFCFGWCDERRTAVITLPRELEGVDLDIDLGSGSVTALGSFGELGLELGAGDATVSGSARSVDAEVSAGDLDLELENVRSASFQVSAGGANARLTGSAPEEVEVEVSAGTVSLTLPDVPYRVASDVAVGDIANSLRVDPAAKHRITADVAAGDLVLRPGERPAR